MSRLLLLDTNLASLLPHPVRPSWLDLYREDLVGHVYAVSTQTAAEMWFGALAAGWGKGRLDRMTTFLDSVLVLGADRSLAETWGRVRAHARQHGVQLSPQDAWVAATAWAHRLPMVTHDAGLAAVPLPGLEVICHAPPSP